MPSVLKATRPSPGLVSGKNNSISRLSIARVAVDAARAAIQTKAYFVKRAIRRRIHKQLHVELSRSTEREVAKAIAPVVKAQIAEIVRGLERLGKDESNLWEKSAPEGHVFYGNQYTEGGGSREQAGYARTTKTPEFKAWFGKSTLLRTKSRIARSLMRRVYDPEDWKDQVISAVLPPLAVGMAKAVVAQMLAVGVDIRRSTLKRLRGLGTKSAPEGHSFYGNQYTEGSGGEGESIGGRLEQVAQTIGGNLTQAEKDEFASGDCPYFAVMLRDVFQDHGIPAIVVQLDPPKKLADDIGLGPDGLHTGVFAEGKYWDANGAQSESEWLGTWAEEVDGAKLRIREVPPKMVSQYREDTAGHAILANRIEEIRGLLRSRLSKSKDPDITKSVGLQTKSAPEGHEFYGNQWAGGSGGSGDDVETHGGGTTEHNVPKGMKPPSAKDAIHDVEDWLVVGGWVPIGDKLANYVELKGKVKPHKKATLDALPSHWFGYMGKNLREVRFEPPPAPYAWATYLYDGRSGTLYIEASGGIPGQNYDIQVVHEVAHALNRASGYKLAEISGMKGTRPTKYSSEKGVDKDSESFAEAVALYSYPKGRKYLQERYPKCHKVIETIYKQGPEAALRITKSFNLETKETTATRWLRDHSYASERLAKILREAGVPGYSIVTELPESMKRRVIELLHKSFEEDYWGKISEATEGAAERILETGLEEGYSIRDMSKQIREELGGDDYARTRSFNIARTESGGALNGARRASMDQLIDDVGEKVPIQRTWLSVLGTTTRETHAALDGVPADEDGMWDLSGYLIPWPGHPSLPADERCNCQCTLSLEFGMDDTQARQLVQDYYGRQEEMEEDHLAAEGEAEAKQIVEKSAPEGHEFYGNQYTEGGAAVAEEGAETSQEPQYGGFTQQELATQVLLDWKGARQHVAKLAVNGLKDNDSIVLRDAKGATAIATVERNIGPSRLVPRGDRGKYIGVAFLATREKGWGRQAFSEIVDHAVDNGAGIILQSAVSAKGFYEKMGMSPVPDYELDNLYYLSPKKCKSWTMQKAVDDEPEDGVFAIPIGSSPEVLGGLKYSEDQPRDEFGRWSPETGGSFGSSGTESSASVKDWVRVRFIARGVSKAAGDKFLRGAAEDLSQVPSHLLGRLENLTIQYHVSQESLLKAAGWEADPMAQVAGFHDYESGDIHVAKLEGSIAKVMPEEVEARLRQSFIHEMSHAVDHAGRSNPQYSGRTAWKRAAREEIGWISDYANTNYREAFAEFGRAVWSKDSVVKRKLEEKCPKCLALWKKWGLV